MVTFSQNFPFTSCNFFSCIHTPESSLNIKEKQFGESGKRKTFGKWKKEDFWKVEKGRLLEKVEKGPRKYKEDITISSLYFRGPFPLSPKVIKKICENYNIFL